MNRLRWLIVILLVRIAWIYAPSLSKFPLSQDNHSPPSPSQDVYTVAKQTVVKIETPSGSRGSGVIVDLDEIVSDQDRNVYNILTHCNFVKEGGSGTYRITTNRETYSFHFQITNPDYLCYSNHANSQDLTVLTLRSTHHYIPARLADFSDLQIGQPIVAAGFPNDSGGQNLTINSGEILGIDANILHHYDIGHSAKIFSGMTGGGIFSSQGELIAINAIPHSNTDAESYAYEFYGISTSFYDQQTPSTSQPKFVCVDTRADTSNSDLYKVVHQHSFNSTDIVVWRGNPSVKSNTSSAREGCITTARNFQEAFGQIGLGYTVFDPENRMICASSSQNGSCKQDLFTIDESMNPEEIIEHFTKSRYDYQGPVIFN